MRKWSYLGTVLYTITPLVITNSDGGGGHRLIKKIINYTSFDSLKGEYTEFKKTRVRRVYSKMSVKGKLAEITVVLNENKRERNLPYTT